MENRTITIKTTDIAHNGAACADALGRKVYVHGMLKDETAIVDVEKKHNILIGEVREFITISPHRKEPEELHYLSCSPWQVIEYPTQLAYKEEILSSLFGYYNDAPKVLFTPAEQYYGYRTKVEFSFVSKDQTGTPIPLSLAFHVRNKGKQKIQLEHGCALVSENMNIVAEKICMQLKEQGLTAYELKALTIRESKSTKACIATLYCKDRIAPPIDLSLIPGLAGLHIWYSTHKSPAAVETELLASYGETTLSEYFGNRHIRYPYNGFFQNNIPVFQKAVERISTFIPKASKILELYCGVGTIGLLLADETHVITGIELNPHSVRLANENALANNISNFKATCLPAEKIDPALINSADCLILDPPRAGLHPRLKRDILEAKPETVIYLSCNPETQARDYADLKDVYALSYIEGFDFYPETPHLESLIVLKKRT